MASSQTLLAVRAADACPAAGQALPDLSKLPVVLEESSFSETAIETGESPCSSEFTFKSRIGEARTTCE